MCSIIGCTQGDYYDSKKGHCYYHWKIDEQLIEPDPDNKEASHTHNGERFMLLFPLVNQAVNKIGLINESRREDLSQHLCITLWMLVPQIRADASKLEVYKFIRLSLFREGVRYAKVVNEEDILSVDMTNLNETFDNSDVFNIEEVVIEEQLDNKRMEVVADFMFYECTKREGHVFYDLFVTKEHETLRSIAEKHEVAPNTIRNIGMRLYERFKECITSYGYTADELLS